MPQRCSPRRRETHAHPSAMKRNSNLAQRSALSPKQRRILASLSVAPLRRCSTFTRSLLAAGRFPSMTNSACLFGISGLALPDSSSRVFSGKLPSSLPSSSLMNWNTALSRIGLSVFLGALGAKERQPPLQAFITTHSPVALRELSGSQLFVMRQVGTKHEARNVGIEDDIQGTIRAFPDAFLASSVVVCE